MTDSTAIDPETEAAARESVAAKTSGKKALPTDERASTAQKIRAFWDQIEGLIRQDPLLAGRSPYLWNKDLYIDEEYPYLWGGKRRAEPAK